MQRSRVSRQIAMLACFAFSFCSAHAGQAQAASQEITVDGSAHTTPFPHFWEQMFGSGRAILSLREAYRRDMRDVKAVTSFHYVRFHAILDDEVGVYNEDHAGNAVYNFSYVDQIYDGLLEQGVRPVVELDFMPRQLSVNPTSRYGDFWDGPNVYPPKDEGKWESLVRAFASHLVDRYGVDEVSQWWFEVWNEPNISTWRGSPKQATYFNLYDHAARAIKSVSSRLRVGGPATAYGAWITDLIAHANQENIPLDFITGHVYGGDSPKKVFGAETSSTPSQDDMVCAATRKMKDEITHSAKPQLPLMVTEFNAGFEEEHSYDSLYMGPFLARTISQCDGLAMMMSYWTFSDVFDEQGPVREPFHNGYGLIAAGGIFKPAYIAFELLHQLGDVRIENPSPDLLVTRKKDDTVVIAAWNLVDPGTHGAATEIVLHLRNLHTPGFAHVYRLDALHSNTLVAYQRMGSPQYPTTVQIKALRDSATLSPPDIIKIQNKTLRLHLLENELALVILGRSANGVNQMGRKHP
jgi:xylan 1,4-beta-xylosidase